MRNEVILISPQQAKSWLENKGENRKLSSPHIRYLANEMKSGRWRLTHQGIAFGEDGRLLDGQHRLAAITEAGIALKMMVTYEVPLGNFPIVDRGMPRNMSVITGIHSFGTQCYQFMIELGRGKRGKISPDDVYLLHKYFAKITDDLQSICNTNTRFFSSAPIRTAAIITVASGKDAPYVQNTYRDLVLQNLKTLPVVALSLVRTYNRSMANVRIGAYRGDAVRVDTYFRARFLFDKGNSDKERIKIGEEEQRLYYKEVASLVKKALELSPNREKSELLKQLAEKDEQIRKMQQRFLKKTALDIEAEQVKLSRGAVG